MPARIAIVHLGDRLGGNRDGSGGECHGDEDGQAFRGLAERDHVLKVA